MSLIAILITYIFINNFILNQFMGMCPFIGVSKDYESAIGMGFAVTFVTSVASLTTWCIQHFLLVPFGLTYLQTITFILDGSAQGFTFPVQISGNLPSAYHNKLRSTWYCNHCSR